MSSTDDTHASTELTHPGQVQPCQATLDTDDVLDILRKSHVRVFCSQYNDAFAYLPWDTPGDHWECIPIRSKLFRNRVGGLVRRAINQRVPSWLMRQIIPELELQAEGVDPVNINNRISGDQSEVWIDLGDNLWRSIRVTCNGVQVVQESEPRFYRPRHAYALPVPVGNGDPYEILKYIPVEDKEDELLFLSWLVAVFSSMPVPMLVFTGPQGSGKTTCSSRTRSLVDPSRTLLLEDADGRDLLLIFYHHAVPCFENVGRYSPKKADRFCRAVTGTGVAGRVLYTNMEEAVFAFRRPIIMNGIDVPSNRPDFLDRCVILPCKRFHPFRTLATLDREFEDARPRLFGAILDLLSKTLSLLASTPSQSEFRMADFTHFGRAVARALGKTAEEFDSAYAANRAPVNRDLIDECSFAQAVVAFAKAFGKSDPFEGTAGSLLQKLTATAKVERLSTKGKSWPGNGRWLTSRLNQLAPALLSQGVVVEQLRRRRDERPWRVYSLAE